MALVSNAAASRDEELRRLMPPPAPRPPSAVTAPKPKAPVVLDEDTYTQHLEAIIERDYFPELPKMANQLEWLRAVNSGDVREMQRAQRNIARRRAAANAAAAAAGAPAATPGLGLGPGDTPGPGGVPPLHTPGWGATTPGTALLRTPAMTPMVGGMAEAGGPSATGAAPAAAAAAPPAPAASGLSLDSFLSQYTSEDNASFHTILEEDNRRKRAKVRHHLERPDPRDPETRRLLLEGPPERPSDEFGTSGQAPMTLLPAPEPPINNLFYDSSQRPAVPLSAKEAAEVALGPPKAINRAATRLRAPPEAAPLSALPQDPAAAAVAAGLPAGAPMPGGAAGTVGYDAMATPALEDVLGSPLMTWGDIESTPLRLGVDDMPVELDEAALMGGAPAFRVQGLTEREMAAHRLAAAKAGSGSAAGRASGARGSTPLLTALRRAATGTGAGGGATARGAGGGATPLAVPLSPAARQLAASIKAGMTPRGAGMGAVGSAAAGGRALPSAGAGAGSAAGRSAALGSGELDKQLRASYRSSAAVSLGGHAHGTPSLGTHRGTTPGLGPGATGRATSTPGVVSGGGGGGAGQRAGSSTPLAGAAGKARRAPIVLSAGAQNGGAAHAGAGGKEKSVTDDLLKL
ncbi:hypothetical protein GPECTOR_42g811 [Gonium pectorale]|uniref:Nuclear protein Es2 n=1 Tax=Gonium pectorale TaxID=33097 RepID=A0A150GB59_GONPE|nr:hypothetical protein GPECTOR_42g811 [Gonium pectorale]|eukprot:KXZ46600.1 hypothetical protein GPECTOR_42g811 [Gonium pectorale]